ncbi:MAG: hypothetical protein WC003_15650 [Terrimicrobiaceae bacterium]
MSTPLFKRLLTRLRGPAKDSLTREFIHFHQRKWPTHPRTDKVVLVGLFSWRPSMCAYSYAVNHFARRNGAQIEAYSFSRRVDPVVEAIYRSFGASLTLRWSSTVHHEPLARELAAQAFGGLKSKDDIFRIGFGGVVLGDLIYDSYLRYFYEPTVRMEDARLLETIETTFRIAMACEEYFTCHRVKTLLPFDAPYIESGVVHRFAIRHGVPIYALEYQPFTLHSMDTEMRPGDPADRRNWPSKIPLYRLSPQVFDGLSCERQQHALQTARAALAERFSGQMAAKIQASYVAPTTAQMNTFGAPSEETLFPVNDRKRMLVLLHDFCDAPNIYRWALFPDFDEWTAFLFAHAAETDFDWYAKPHPNIHYDRRMNDANDRIIAQIKQRYPHIHFLCPSVSNRQILAEGIDAVFTVYGTCGHEFAYHGVPVINAGDNPHIEYNFNFNPCTHEEYKRLILGADRLQIDIDRRDIEKFYYTYHFHPYELSSGVSILPDVWMKLPNLPHLESSTEVFRYFMENDSPERDRRVADYIDAFMAAQAHAPLPFVPAQPQVHSPPICKL